MPILRFHNKLFFLENNDLTLYVYRVYNIVIYDDKKEMNFYNSDGHIIFTINDYSKFASIGYVGDKHNHFIVYNYMLMTPEDLLEDSYEN